MDSMGPLGQARLTMDIRGTMEVWTGTMDRLDSLWTLWIDW